jgi:hypothetical protein
LFINYVISIKKKLKPKQTYIERSSFHYAWYLQVDWPRCEGTPLLRCETALEEAASHGGADTFSWSAPKEMSSSLLEELGVTVCWRRAVDFIRRIYTNVYELLHKLTLIILKKFGSTSPIPKTTHSFQTCNIYNNHNPYNLHQHHIYNLISIGIQSLIKIQQHLPYIIDYPQFSNLQSLQ